MAVLRRVLAHRGNSDAVLKLNFPQTQRRKESHARSSVKCCIHWIHCGDDRVPKSAGADANFGCAFLNGGLKVVRHPHRKHRQALAQLRFEGITQMPKPRENTDALPSGSSRNGGIHISPARCNFSSCKIFSRKGGKLTFRHAALRFFTAEMHLN